MSNKKLIFHQAEKRPQYMRHQTSHTPVGWCSHNAHRGKLSLKQMRNHNCRGKNCPFFTKNENHPHWKHKQAIKESKIIKVFESEITKALNNLEGAKDG